MRFPGFTDEWKKTIFKEVCKISTGSKNTQDKIDNGLYPFYVRSQTIERINEYTYDGEAILTAGDGVGVGKVFHYSTGKIGVHQRVYLLTDFKCDGKYLFYYFSSKFYDRVKKMSAKNSVDSVRMEMIADMPISLPSLKEQTQIGILLSKLDERIATQNKIIDDLQSLIKGLSKTLTNQGEPNTRISDCLECHTSTLQEGTLNENGLYPVYGASGSAGFLNDYRCDKDSILIIKDGSGAGTVSYATGKYSVIGTLNYLTAKSEYSLKYLYFCLMGFNFEPFKTGMAIPHIYFRVYGQAKIYCPSIEEQEHIAKVLTIIENKLNIESMLLKFLYMEKQYLLNNMFI